MNFVRNFTTYNEFRRYLINNVSYDNHHNQTMWGPVIVSEQFDVEFFFSLDVYPIFLETVSKMAVIVPYSKLSLHVKLFSGTHKLYFLLLLALLACCLTGWEILFSSYCFLQQEQFFFKARYDNSTVRVLDISASKVSVFLSVPEVLVRQGS